MNDSEPSGHLRHIMGLIAGPVLAVATYGTLVATDAGLDHAGRATAGLAVWMAVWWLTEAIHVSATALLPIAVLPISGARSIAEATTPYGHHLMFLFLGGFVLALSMERWDLHRRIALHTLRLVGSGPRSTVAGFMGVTAFLSMWTSNTATAVIMLPIALSVIDLVARELGDSEPSDSGQLPESTRNFALCLMLGIAYGASIGGVGTLIGTPPNVFLASYVQDNLGLELSFVRWLVVGIPLVVVLLPVTWGLLTHLIYPIRLQTLPGGRALFREQLDGLGKPGRGEIVTLVVFVLTASAWLAQPWLAELEVLGRRPLAGLSDAGIAVLAALSLFVIPVDLGKGEFVMNWGTAKRLPWGILLLFGGGLSLAAAMADTGVAAFLGRAVAGVGDLPGLAVVLMVTALVVFLTEVTSNTATAAAFIPILAGIAPGLGLHPMRLLVPAALAASCAFMMPVATPPNAIVFGSGYLSIPQMARAGLWLNLVAIACITGLSWWGALDLLGMS